MIIDHIQNAAFYYGCHLKLQAILRYIEENRSALERADAGPQQLSHELDALGVTMKIVAFDTVEGTRKWESHVKNSFVYYMLEGKERTGYADISEMGGAVKTEGKDQIVYHEGDGDRILFPTHHFMVILPQDAHMSKLADGKSERARKCSFKFQW